VSNAAVETLPASSLRVLLRGAVDYAGLFPPASRDMPAAVAEYARHRADPSAWALGRFVLPAARLDEFHESSGHELPRDGANSWALSALLGSDIEEDIARIERFNDRHLDARLGAVYVDTVELKTHSVREVERAAELLDRRFDTYMEVPIVEDPAELIAAISGTKAQAKVRTGGVTPDAFPASAHVARFIARCAGHNVAFKATAGLHHPWRAEYPLTYAPDSARNAMFGFVNVLLCVAALHDGWSDDAATRILEERDPERVTFDDEGARWESQRIGRAALQRARDTMASFGSCSFVEPVTDLRASRLL